jgi:peptidyl-prolyl cis-trans isomerase A (cyclophilin A)
MKKLLVTLVLLMFLAPVSFAEEPTATVLLTMQTSMGTVELELYPGKAPLTVTNFLKLVDGKYLDGATFYRTVSPENDNGEPPIAVIQGGIGDAESPFSPIAHETTDQTGLPHLDGSLSMARAAVGTASTEFFICIGDQPALDFGAKRNPDGQGFAVFGRVVAGMDVIHAIHQAPADAPTDFEYFQNQLFNEPILIESIRRSEP